MSKFTEAKLEEAIIGLLGDEGYPHVLGETITRDPTEVLIKDDLKTYLLTKYNQDGITKGEIDSIIRRLETFSAHDLYESNKYKAIEFTKAFNHVVERYNNREELEAQQDNIVNDFADEIINLMHALKEEKNSFKEMDIDFEEKVFYDILKALAEKYEFEYPDEKLIVLSKRVKEVVADKTRYTDWSKKDDIKAELKVDLILLLAEHNYPPVDREEVYTEVFEQAKNFKKHRTA